MRFIVGFPHSFCSVDELKGVFCAVVTLRLAFLIVLFSLSVTAARAQEKIVIPLRINLEYQQFAGRGIAERTDNAPLIYTSPTGNGVAHAPGKVLFKLEPAAGSSNSYQLYIDANGDGDLRNEKPQTLAPNSTSTVSINRSWSNERRLVLPYALEYSRNADSRGRMQEFSLDATLSCRRPSEIGKCESLFVVLDLSTDGQFDDVDLGGDRVSVWTATPMDGLMEKTST